jgi:transcriptional regulator with XRE-family HTH domain
MDSTEIPLYAADRLRELRTQAGIGQAEFARRMGLPSRQALSDIERRRRTFTPQEVIAAAGVLTLPPSALLTRVGQLPDSALHFHIGPCEDRQAVLLEARRVVERVVGIVRHVVPPAALLRPSLPFVRGVTRDAVWLAAEQVGGRLGLGVCPAGRLAAALDLVYGVRVMVVDFPSPVESASVHSLEGMYVLLSRHQTSRQQAVDLSHHLFHLMTWHGLPPAHVAASSGPRGVERLAVEFAGALLLPRLAMAVRWSRRFGETRAAWVVRSAREMGVPSVFLGERVVGLGLLPKKQWSDMRVVLPEPAAPPPSGSLWGPWFVDRLANALYARHLTVAKAADLLDMSEADVLTLAGMS